MQNLNHFDEERNSAAFTDKEIFTKLWSQPRLVFRYINDYRYDKYTHILLILASITRGLDRASTKNMGDTMSLPKIIALSIIAGGVFGWMAYYIYAASMSWIGKCLNGVATTSAILRILAYAMTPAILSLGIIVTQIAIFGNSMFQSEIDLNDKSLFVQGFYYLSLLIELTLGIWATCLVVVGISEVQKFSIGKSILNLLLPGILIVAVVLLVVLSLG